MTFDTSLKTDLNQVYRYLGYKEDKADDDTLIKIQAAAEAVEKAASPRWCYRWFENSLDALPGNDIKEHLKNSGMVYLMAVTLGHGVDMLMLKSGVAGVENSVLADTCASVLAEQYANEASRLLSLIAGCPLTPRFSPGYGDMPLEFQKSLLTMLDAGKLIGLSVSESGILFPRKSITAAVGTILGGQDNSPANSCGICRLNGKCRHQKEGSFCGKN